VIKGCNIFWGQKLPNTCSFMDGRIIVQKKIESGNTLSESEELQSWECSKILLSFLMRVDGEYFTAVVVALPHLNAYTACLVTTYCYIILLNFVK
jgi:hypothetical protein